MWMCVGGMGMGKGWAGLDCAFVDWAKAAYRRISRKRFGCTRKAVSVCTRVVWHSHSWEQISRRRRRFLGGWLSLAARIMRLRRCFMGLR